MSEGPRIEIVQSETGREIRIHDPKAVAAKLGDTTLAAFYRCFNGADRLIALEHLLYLNNEAQHTAKPRVVADDYAHNRNMRVLAFLISGTLYEIGDALQALCASKVALKITDRASWAPLNEMRAEWNKEAFAGTIRNNFSHHLGEIKDYVSGIAKDDAPNVVTLYRFAKNTRHSGEVIEPWDVLFRAHGIKDDAMEPFVKKTYGAHSRLPELLFALFAEVLDSQGLETVVTNA